MAAMGLFMACAPTSNKDTTKAPMSNDLLESLTGFGESLSKRNYLKAVDYMVPEEKAMMMENGTVPPEKQKMLLALPLQRLIRNPSVHIEKGRIAGIYALLPNLTKSEMPAPAMSEGEGAPADASATSEETPISGSKGAMSENPPSGQDDEDKSSAPPENPVDPRLKQTINEFFSAVNKKNWAGVLALMTDEEKKLLLDDKGNLKEASKQRLSQMDQKNRGVLILQDGKLTGVTLLLPAD